MGAAILPALIGGIASIGGSIMQANAQQAAVDEQNRLQQEAMKRQQKVRQDEEARQEQMRLQQQKIMEESQSKQDVGSVTEQLEDVKEKRSEVPEKLAADVAAMSPGEVAPVSRTNQPGVTVVDNDQAGFNADLGERLAQASQGVRQYLKAKSDVGAYGQLFGDRARDYGLANEALNFQGKKRQGSLSIAEQEADLVGRDFANTVHPNLFAGSLVSGLGNMVTSFGKGGYG